MSFCLRPNTCKKCGKPLKMFEGWVCLECEKVEQEPSDTVSRGVFEQVMRERDVAIEQLKELGYELGQKIEPCEVEATKLQQAYNKGFDDCRQAVLDAMYELCDTGETLKENPWRDNPHIDAITDAIDNLPPVTQKSGKWIDREEYDADRWKCSICGRTEQYQERYCPSCGAKMESEVNNG